MTTRSRFPSSGPTADFLGARVRRAAAADGVAFSYGDGVWVAADVGTGELASDLSMAGAWAHLREVDVQTVHQWLADAGATVVRPPKPTSGA